jgi:hypothetical protein
MAKTTAEMSLQDLEELVDRLVQRRTEVLYVQLMDALGLSEEDELEFKPEFAASLRRSIEQAKAGEGIDLGTFRAQLGL